MTGSEVRGRLRAWILQRAKEQPTEFHDDTPVLENGLLSSLDVVELILYIEQLKGEEVSVESLEPEAIRDVNSIYETFFEPG